MPFRSERQRRFMYARHPAIAARWTAEAKAAKRPAVVAKGLSVANAIHLKSTALNAKAPVQARRYAEAKLRLHSGAVRAEERGYVRSQLAAMGNPVAKATFRRTGRLVRSKALVDQTGVGVGSAVSVAKKRLTAAERRALPDSAFVYPATRRYPIPDKAHARNAMARVNQEATSGSPSKVARKVHRKFPSIGKANTWATNAVGKADDRQVRAGLLTAGGGALALRGAAEVEHRAVVRVKRAQGAAQGASMRAAQAGEHAAALAGRRGAPAARESARVATSLARRADVTSRATARLMKPRLRGARQVKGLGALALAGGAVAAYRGLRKPSYQQGF